MHSGDEIVIVSTLIAIDISEVVLHRLRDLDLLSVRVGVIFPHETFSGASALFVIAKCPRGESYATVSIHFAQHNRFHISERTPIIGHYRETDFSTFLFLTFDVDHLVETSKANSAKSRN